MDYHLKPIGKVCAATGADLTPGTTCHSVLLEEHGQLTRIDYSAEGWDGPPVGTIAHWKCVVPETESGDAKPLDTEGLMRYFEQLVEDANPAQEKFCYVLALLLLQKKRLKLEGSRDMDGTEALELIGSQGEGPFELRDQQLTGDEIQSLQESVNVHLATEWS